MEAERGGTVLVVLGYCDKDEELATKLAGWMAELGPYTGHKLLVARDISSKVRPFTNVGFDEVTEIEIRDDVWRHWPESCNNVFSHVSRHIEYVLGAQPFLWLEADVVPLRSGWLNSIAMEYEQCGSRFMGDFVSVHTPELDVPDHMSGIAVYPGSMTNNAGMALITQDMAWDVAAAYQIVPRMATSKLILHNWKHPPFEDFDAIRKEIYDKKPECVLFHADKSGSLIDLLRSKNAGVVDGAGGNLRTGALTDPMIGPLPIELSAPACDILIKSYPPDYDRLRYCLRSIHKFCSGFRGVVVVIPAGDGNRAQFTGAMEGTLEPILANLKVIEVMEQGEGYLYQQAVKACAHEYSDAEYILHIDSDTMFTRHVTPLTFFRNGKILWLYTRYSEIVTPWQRITEKFMDEAVDYEFMRRLPLLMPRWLHVDLARFALERHRTRLSDYIIAQPSRGFSEFNALGAFAFTRAKDKFEWLNTTENPLPDTVALQRWTGDPFDDSVKAKCEEILSGGGNGVRGEPVTASDSTRHRTPPPEPSVNGAAECSNCGGTGSSAYDISPNEAGAKKCGVCNGTGQNNTVKLEQQRSRMAHARSVMLANRAAGIKPARRGRGKKKRKIRV